MAALSTLTKNEETTRRSTETSKVCTMADGFGFESYRSTKTVVSESVYQFLHGSLYGAAWGAVTPFPAPGSPAAAREAATGIFRPIAPFSALSAIPSNALFFGCILGVQRLSSKSLELLRRKEDVVNDLFGLVVLLPYHRYCLAHSEKGQRRLLTHNRTVGSIIVLSVLYANLLA